MPDYRHLTRDELLRLAHENADLTDEARLLLDAEFARRGLSNDDLRSFEDDQAAATTASQKEVREVSIRGIGKRLMGRTNYSHDPGLRIEEFDATLWVVLFWIPVVPLATYRIRRTFRRWWHICASDRYRVLERLPRNWEQILGTWIKAIAVLLLIRLAVPFLLRRFVYR